MCVWSSTTTLRDPFMLQFLPYLELLQVCQMPHLQSPFYCLHYYFLFIVEDDYSGLPQDLLFTPFETLQCFYVNISLDSIEEEPENFHLVLVTRDPDVIFYTRTAPVYILDSDSKLVN